MGGDLAWTPGSAEPVAVIAAYTTAYALQFFLGRAAAFEGLATRVWAGPGAAVFARKLLGLVCLGGAALALVAALPATASDLGLGLPGLRDLAWVGIAGPAILALVLATSRGRDPVHPEVRPPRWTRRLLLANGAAWTLYLLGYEAALRGVFLLACVRAFGTWPAVVLNLSIYVFIHFPRGGRETAASVPFGVLACLAVLDTGTFWAPFALHAVAAVTNDTARALRSVPKPA